jgi:ribosome-associated translation inhibitor RaiA
MSLADRDTRLYRMLFGVPRMVVVFAQRRIPSVVRDPGMDTPTRITYRHVELSTALQEQIEKHLSRLRREHQDIIDCHVTIEAPAGAQSASSPHEVSIDLTMPGRHIGVHSGSTNLQRHTDVCAAVHDAFEILYTLLTEQVSHPGASPDHCKTASP